MTEETSTPTAGDPDGPDALADDPTNDADGRGVESTSNDEASTFEPEEDPEAAG